MGTRFDLLATDLDGTLLSPDHRLPPRTIGRLRAARDRGVMIVLCSARQPQPIWKYRLEAGLEGPIIAYSGALILGGNGEELLYTSVPPDAGVAVLDAIGEIGGPDELSVHVYVHDRWFVERDDDMARVEAAANDGAVPTIADDLRQVVRDGGGFAKTMIIGIPERLEMLRNVLQRRMGSAIICVPSQATHYEVLRHDVSKGAALAWLAEHLGVAQERILVIGDNYNDLPMFDVAGFSVAVANAPEAIRQRADLVVPSNVDEGACLAIDQLILADVAPRNRTGAAGSNPAGLAAKLGLEE